MRCFGKKVHTHHCKVVLLDEQELIQEIQDTTPGQEVLDTVFRHLNLLETAYFGLRYLDASSQTHWLDPGKKVAKQLKGTDPFTLYFGVKFYAADPCKLLEEITRYQFFLQVKQDILQGRLPVSFDLAAELGSYVVQSELGDYDQRRHSAGYVSEFRFLANQTVELESRIAELHKGLVGQIPAVAELNYLEKVKWLDMYGVDLHPVLGEDNVEYFLGLTPSGIIVLRNKTKVGNYYWPRITKVYFKGRYFMLRVCDKNSEENTYGFETPSKQACKHLWKCCVEHHAFFRLVQVSPPHAASSDAPSAGGGSVFSIGSRFRYSGRTEKQAQADAQMRLRSPPQFTRTPSRRYQRRIVEGAQDMPIVEENSNNENIPPQEMKNVSIPQPVHTVTSMYRSTSIPSVLPRSDSPRSIRSAPWTAATNTANTTAGSGMSMTRGLYSGASPRSVRSAPHHPPNTQLLSRLTRRSSSVESQSSVDSRSCKRHHHHHRSRRGSDNDSEVSKSSCRSHSHRRHRSHHKRDSGSENDQQHRHRHRSYRHRHGSNYELVDSEAQWKEVQRKQAEGQSGIQQATVIRDLGNRRSGYMNSGMETESELSYHHKRKHKKHRSRSRSPDTKARLPDELKKHLEFDLIETEGMTADQLKEIPYKAVETETKPPKIKYSPNSKRRQRSPRRSKSSTLDERCQPPNSGDSPPPPYSPPQQGGLGPGPPNGNIGSSQENTTTSPLSPAGDGNGNLASTNPAISGSLADLLKSSNPSTTNHSPAGSVRSNHLPRAGASGSSSIPPSGHSSHRQAALNYSANKLTNSIYTPGITFSSALYGNAGKLLGNTNIPNGHASSISMSSGSSTKYHEGAYHEHSDSGLGADSQDYIYNGRNNETSRYLQASRISAAFTKPVSTSKTYPIPSPLATMRSGHSGNMAFKSSQPSNHHSTPPHKQLDRHGTMASNRSLGNHTNPIDDLKRSHPGLGGWLSPENSSSSPRHTTYSPGSYPSSNSQRSQSLMTNQSQHYARRPQLPLPTAKATNQSLVPPPSPSSTNYHESWDDRKHQQSVGGAVGGGIGGIGGGDTPALGPRVPSRLAGSMRSVRSGPAGADGGWRTPLKDSNKTNTGDHKEDPRNAQGRHQGEGQILRRARSSSLELILSPIIQSTYQQRR